MTSNNETLKNDSVSIAKMCKLINKFNKHNGTNVLNLIPASQAQLIIKYRNIKGELFKCNSSIYF
jgi:hypothetical protein